LEEEEGREGSRGEVKRGEVRKKGGNEERGLIEELSRGF
jgi:hypothetical protein